MISLELSMTLALASFFFFTSRGEFSSDFFFKVFPFWADVLDVVSTLSFFHYYHMAASFYIAV
jgi:hypothetical protein